MATHGRPTARFTPPLLGVGAALTLAFTLSACAIESPEAMGEISNLDGRVVDSKPYVELPCQETWDTTDELPIQASQVTPKPSRESAKKEATAWSAEVRHGPHRNGWCFDTKSEWVDGWRAEKTTLVVEDLAIDGYPMTFTREARGEAAESYPLYVPVSDCLKVTFESTATNAKGEKSVWRAIKALGTCKVLPSPDGKPGLTPEDMTPEEKRNLEAGKPGEKPQVDPDSSKPGKGLTPPKLNENAEEEQTEVERDNYGFRS